MLDRKEYMKKYREKLLENNPEYDKNQRILYKEKREQYRINHKDETKKLSESIRHSLKGSKQGGHWENLVGYSLDCLIKYLKKTIPVGYNWNDFLKGNLELDHYFPISIYNFNKPSDLDFKRCWALENLRLLPKGENRRKSNKLEKSFQLSLKDEFNI